MRRVPQEVKSPSRVQPDADIAASPGDSPAPLTTGFPSKLSASSRMHQGLCREAARPPLAVVKSGTRPCKKERRKGGWGGAEYVCGVMLMSLQLHDCPLWPSVAPPAIDQGRVSRSLAASQCALGRWRDEFISFTAAAAAALADGSGAVDTVRNYFLIAGSFGGTRSGLFFFFTYLSFCARRSVEKWEHALDTVCCFVSLV